jgi:hypothetical protein
MREQRKDVRSASYCDSQAVGTFGVFDVQRVARRQRSLMRLSEEDLTALHAL